jgi:hypothetical protein
METKYKIVKIKFSKENIQKIAKENVGRQLTEMEIYRMEQYCTFCGEGREEADSLLEKVIDEVFDNTDAKWLKVDRKYLNGRGKNINNPEVKII